MTDRPARWRLMDPFEDVVRTMRIESSYYVRLQMRAPFGIEFDSREQPRVVVIARGSGWLTSSHLPQPTAVTAGDCLLVKADARFTLRDQRGSRVVPCSRVLTRVTGQTVQHGGDGPLTELISGALSFDAAAAEPLVALMPALVHVRLEQAHAHLLESTLQLIGLEAAAGALGASTVIHRLADVLFVQAVRAWCATDGGPAVRWLAGLKDHRLAPAIRAMHEDLAHPWTVESLARTAGLSRSSFAAAFKSVTGESPLDYLTGWRMYRAKMLLRNSDLALMEIASRVGYDNDTALSRAFRRHEGIAPGQWRRAGAAAPGQTPVANVARSMTKR